MTIHPNFKMGIALEEDIILNSENQKQAVLNNLKKFVNIMKQLVLHFIRANIYLSITACLYFIMPKGVSQLEWQTL